MKTALAMQLIAKQMEWDTQEATEQFRWLKMMAEAKYDDYQGYGPGTRFYVNLLAWISQFPVKRRATAFNLLRERLIFYSQREIHHLVELTMPILKEKMMEWVAEDAKIPLYRSWGDDNAQKRAKLMGIRTLYVGLSDGAKIDVFRRENEGYVSNEQIVAASEISDKKWDKLIESLRERLNASGFNEKEGHFERICLIDDFTASGTTLIRFDSEAHRWKGKIPVFCEQNAKRIEKGLIAPDCWILAHHYLGTFKAESTSKEQLDKFRNEHPRFTFTLTFSSILNKNIVIDDRLENNELKELLTTHYDPSVEDKILGKNIWYGYKGCGLPVVLYHNTPNNSLALLWASSGNSRDEQHPLMKPLFSRKKRHSDHG